MSDKDKSSNVSRDTVVEHPKLKRDRALALFLARSHARNHGKPLPDPATIGPAVFTRIKPEMTRDEIRKNVYAALERNGITVKPNKD
jgi:hypothetical protein